MAYTKDQEIEFRGYDKIEEYYVPDSDLERTFDTISRMKRIQDVYDVHKMNLKEALSDTRRFYKEQFKLHPVPYVANYRFFNKTVSLLKPINPLKLPLDYVDCEDIFSGTVVERFVNGDVPVVSFIKIILSNPITEHTSTSYVHELMHTQVDSLRGCVTSFYDAEVLSIFIELVFTYMANKDERMLNLEDSRRMQEMSLMYDIIRKFANTGVIADEDRINLDGESEVNKNLRIRDEILENTKYLVSDLKAYNLFITYYYASNDIKSEILKWLQRVINGEITLNDYLNKFDVTMESSQDSKRLIKYFGR